MFIRQISYSTRVYSSIPAYGISYNDTVSLLRHGIRYLLYGIFYTVYFILSRIHITYLDWLYNIYIYMRVRVSVRVRVRVRVRVYSALSLRGGVWG